MTKTPKLESAIASFRLVEHGHIVALKERRSLRGKKAKQLRDGNAKIEGSKEDIAAYMARVPPKRY